MNDVRPGRPEDLDDLWAIEKAAFEPARRASRRSLLRSLRAGRTQRVYVAPDGFLVAWCRPRTWRVYDVSVRPEAQGRGVGSALMDAVEADAASQGARWMVLEADAARPPLVAWYEARGYRRAGMALHHYGRGRHAVRLRRAL